MTSQLVAIGVDMQAFNRWAAVRGLVKLGTYDEGHALHVLLCSTFGTGALKPFRLFASPRRRAASLYAYADQDAAALRETAEFVGTPDCLAAIDVGQLRSKAMRTDYAPGQRLGFDIRVRPVRRLLVETTGEDGRALRKGAEVDVFVGDSRQDAEPKTERGKPLARRQVVYANWLSERLGGAVCVDRSQCRLVSFRRSRAVRGDGLGPGGPDATMQGELTVLEPEAFAGRVRHGVGRHKAYGYGMLLLRPAPRRTPE